MNFKTVTLGCKVNQYESEAIASILKKSGFKRVESGSADIIIINSCTVTAESDRKVRQILRREKRNSENAVMVLTGCMAQAFPEKSRELTEADIILGTSNRTRLTEHIMGFISHRQRIVDITPHENGEKFESMEIDEFCERTRAYLKIQDGCNRFCSYCIIPYARGRVRSKPLDEIVSESKKLSEAGYQEIVLTGINLSAYGQDLNLHLCDAIEAVCGTEKIKRVRLGSLEPEQLTPRVIERMAKQKKLCPQFHLSLQSGCNATLKRMNRHYTAEEYMEIANNLRRFFEKPAITTDIMVGFPGETDEEFLESLEFAKDVGFAKAHIFAYSRRPGTKADEMSGQVENKIKEERSKKLIDATTQTGLEFNKALVGKILPVLFEQEADKNVYQGHTETYVPVFVNGIKNIKGQILDVLIDSADENCCFGHCTN